ncbi:hypothetical protein Q604_UNBC18028G0001, partial [human gut metagenome]
MPELVAKKKSKPAINTFDFSFFEKHNGKHDIVSDHAQVIGP